MSEPAEQKTQEAPDKQAWINIWIDDSGGLGFEANSASTTQLLGIVKLAEQMIIQRALSQGEAESQPAV